MHIPVLDFIRGRPPSNLKGLEWPWWIPACMTALAVGATVVAVLQRDPFFPPGLDDLLGLLAVAPWVIEHLSGWMPPRWLFAGVVAGATAGMMIVGPVENDMAPLLLCLLAGELAATSSVRLSAPYTLGLAGVLVGIDAVQPIDGSVAIWIAVILAGWNIGFVMQWQMKELERERKLTATRSAQAASEERQRIAREVHDVIAHSLSITLLHLTAARRDLEDGDGDVSEAVDALRDAERLGRQAMTDIRRTVGLLNSSSPGTAALPGLDEIADLVAEFRRAGMDVTYQAQGDHTTLPQATGLGLYRIAQESLSNVAKHAPGARVRAALDLTADPPRFTVWNSLPTTASPPGEGGAGLRGMRERCDLMNGRFRAGPNGSGWLVEVRLPGSENDTALPAEACDKLPAMFRWRTPAAEQ
ncbi:MAG: sensor histidine kinase [Micromonosporaceae bacterium]